MDNSPDARGSNNQPQPQIIQVQTSNNRLPAWMLGSVTLGFLLPMCSCFVLGFGFLFALTLGGGSGAAPEVAIGDTVGVVRVEGIIYAQDGTQYTAGAGSGIVIDQLKRANADPNVKAVVLRIDSPGGSVVGSAQIYEQILKMEKPVVVSMAATAASSNYYISAPADYIFARPNTFTGSIGVIVSVPNAEELFEELGVENRTITSAENKEFGSLFTELTPEQVEILQVIVDETFQEFVQIVADGRGLSIEDVIDLADGRIYTGRQALALGLVDELGNLDDAIAEAAARGGISGEPNILEYRNQPTFADFLGGVSLRLNQSEAALLQDSLDEITTPRLEFRYVGPGTD